jgi:hypothetical protein
LAPIGTWVANVFWLVPANLSEQDGPRWAVSPLTDVRAILAFFSYAVSKCRKQVTYLDENRNNVKDDNAFVVGTVYPVGRDCHVPAACICRSS